MQTLLHLYILVLLIYLTLFRSPQQVRTNKLLWVILLLLVASIAIETSAIFNAQLPVFLLVSLYLAQCLYIPAIYLYFYNQYYHDGLSTEDLVHLTPFVVMCLNVFVSLLMPANSPSLPAMALPPGLIIYGSTAFYCLLLLLLIKPKVKDLLRASKKSQKLFSVIRSNPAPANRNHTPYPVEGLSEQKIAQMNTLIQQALEDKKPFLQRRYSLKDLAVDTGIPLHHLSAFINNYCKMNFNDYINEYRVQYSQEKMRNQECTYKKLETIAKESGFNNRNTFTAAFKKVTGLTPSQFLREVNLQAPAILAASYEQEVVGA